VLAIAEAVEDKLHEAGAKPLRREGRSEGRWVLLDFGDVVVHVFHEEDRLYYSLERLWKDCPVIPLNLPVGPRPTE
jgi:ribosome-associated protein